MQYRRLGRTNLKVSAIGHGTISIPDVSEEQAVATIHRALDLGINFIDTGRVYGDSEDKIGKVMKTRREECILCSKTIENEASGAMKSLDASLKALGTDKIDIYCAHGTNVIRRYERIMMRGGALDALKKARAQGKIDYIGFSSHWSREMMKALIRSEEFDVMIVAYNLIDEEEMGEEVIPLAKEHDMGVVTMKPLLAGRLTTPVPEGSPPLARDPIVAGCLKHNLSNEAVSCVIPGMTAVAQVEANAPLGDITEKITDEEKDWLYRELGKQGKGYCLRCGYCLPCPEGIDIPRVYYAWHAFTKFGEEARYLGVNIYSNIEVKPDKCTECGECERKCPAGLPIIEQIKEAAQSLEPALEARVR